MMQRRIILILAVVSFILCFRELRAGDVGRESDYYQEDEIVGRVHRPYAKREYNWPEYKNGKIVFRTNNLGFREDVDTNSNKTKGVVRVLVTGDSQVDGVVNNSESFPYVLESKLNTENQATKFEFLNGGVGYYGPEQYSLFLNKYLFLNPDIYVVCIYTGNDFIDSARILEAREGLNERPAEYIRSLHNCMLSDGAINQVANQIYYFKTFPQMREKTVKHVLELIVKIGNNCKQHNIDFLLVFLPTKADVEWQSDVDTLEKVKNCLTLNESDLKINRELTEALIQGVLKNNINFIDFYDSMKNKNVEFYWKKDYHLNVRGHSFIAEKMYEKYYSFFMRSKR